MEAKEKVYVELTTAETVAGEITAYDIKYGNCTAGDCGTIAECWDREIAKAIGAAIAEKMLIVNHDSPIQHFSDRSATELEVWYRD